jgi:hypothetical protein
MADERTKEWVLPASIPFADLKGRDLEECVYWLFDAMGAKDLEWRTGGSGGGAPDGPSDREAVHFGQVELTRAGSVRSLHTRDGDEAMQRVSTGLSRRVRRSLP